nr:hypothetical protein [uncultured Flavobacterium sp.]
MKNYFFSNYHFVIYSKFSDTLFAQSTNEKYKAGHSQHQRRGVIGKSENWT